jgi:hypothetical protein
LKAIDFENGIKLFVKENAAAIERQSNSIDANSTRLSNQQFLQQQGLDQNPELIGAINSRIKAEMELTEAMKPFKETMVQFDIGLTKLATSMLRLTAGKNGDGTEKTERERAQEVGSAGFPEGLAIDPSVMGGGPKPSTDGEKPKDPISMLYRFLTNTPDYEKGPANGPMLNWTLTSVAGLKFPPLDMSKLGAGPPDETGQMKQFRMPPAFTVDDIIQGAKEQQRLKEPVQPNWLGPGDLNGEVINKPSGSVDNSTHNDVKVELNIDARGMDATEVKQLSAETFHDEFNKVLRTVRADQTEIE